MRKIYIILIFFSVLLQYSCNSDKKNTEVLNLGVMSSMDYLPLAVAGREGYFDKLGLRIKIHKFYSANERDAAFQSGNVDGVVIDYTGAILQKSGGFDLKLTSKCDAPFYIVAGANTTIDSLSQLKGAKVAVSQNTVIDYIVDMALQSVGLTASDIEKIEMNKIPLRFEMLRNGKIDATGLPNPFALMAEKAGDKMLTSNADLGFSITGIMFSQYSIDTKKDMIVKMYEGYNMGVDYLKSHTVEDIKDILIKDLGFTDETISKAVLPNYTKAQMPSDADIQKVVEWLATRKLIESSFDKNSLLDNQFVQ
ncbi:hypothetical protein D0T53_07240 [Dysgonomonas sp. 216]|uniref:ABC transporter substrate-binding protein n=1 Tax=Dysgonomonas sp. 216 TaxID=2302934 RepID=UPI0013D2DB60|nr:MetQ/NlpA family ABC transporter substrate-binding protein [Dysgonomonas sp. 216]NDW18339.1 hypothetical protein [Dysgonomonas sp. 216]NDW18707.1 hypothetical protein [Dysgonomonas sp. 216]